MMDLEKNELHELGTEPELHEVEQNQEEQPTAISSDSDSYKEYCKLKTPSGYEIELGSFTFNAEELVNISLKIFQFLQEKSTKKINGGNYVG